MGWWHSARGKNSRAVRRERYGSNRPLPDCLSSFADDHNETRRRHVVFIARRQFLTLRQFETGSGHLRAQVKRAVGITQPSADRDAFAIMGLDREGEQPA